MCSFTVTTCSWCQATRLPAALLPSRRRIASPTKPYTVGRRTNVARPEPLVTRRSYIRSWHGRRQGEHNRRSGHGIDISIQCLSVLISTAQLADVKKGITDDDISALATDEANQPAVIWDLTDLQARHPAPADCLNPMAEHHLSTDLTSAVYEHQLSVGTLAKRELLTPPC